MRNPLRRRWALVPYDSRTGEVITQGVRYRKYWRHKHGLLDKAWWNTLARVGGRVRYELEELP